MARWDLVGQQAQQAQEALGPSNQPRAAPAGLVAPLAQEARAARVGAELLWARRTLRTCHSRCKGSCRGRSERMAR